MRAVTPEEIDGGFVPRARPDVASVAVGTEVVLARLVPGTSHLQACALNESGAIVWQCFDGSGTVDEIAADIAEVFRADAREVSADVCALAREVGTAGLLDGVEPAADEPAREPTGIPVGGPAPVFAAHDEAGRAVSAEQLRGRRALLVNWSPTCSFCALIVGDLAALAPDLAAQGVDVVLVADGGAGANRRLLDRHRLAGRLWLLDDEDSPADDDFVAFGTPVAYLVDETGTVTAPLALGATDVLNLAERAAAAQD